MICASLTPGWMRALRSTVLAVALVALCMPSGGEATAQSLAELVVQRRLELRQAEADHRAALAAFSVVEQRWSAALDDVTLARRSGSRGSMRAPAVTSMRCSARRIEPASSRCR